MIIQFPTPYPDELLYSIIARYHIRSGNVFWKHTLEDLFGKRTISATAFLPSGIESLVQHLPQNTTLTAQALIEAHTMYPFYTVFLPTEKAQSIYESMMSDDGKRIYMQSGIMASSIPQNQYLKYCSECAKEDLSMYGELYWHRLHQLPGQLICSKHGLWLEDSKVPIIYSNKHAFILPTTSNCDLNKVRIVNGDALQQFRDVILQAEYLLNKQYQSQSFSHFTGFYRHHLIKTGFANFNGRVNQKKLQDAFRKYYSEQLLKSLYVDDGQWLASISRKHRKSFHPYQHILLLNLLGLDVNAVFETTTHENDPFGQPNWPCLNVICPEHRKSIIKVVTIRRCEKTKKPIGRFTCPKCGFSYTRKGKDLEQKDRYKYTRIMEFGFPWKKELESLLEEGISYREIARRLGVDPNTVIKYEKIINTKTAPNKEAFKKNDLVKERRFEWLQLQKNFPNLSKTELRRLSPAVYASLYRHDREWLNRNSPNPQKENSIYNRVNWMERDQEILNKVQMVVNELRNNGNNPIRITVKTLGDGIGERALLEKHLDRLPETKVFIDQVYESEKDFRVRRVEHVINKMKEGGEVIKAWKVLRRAAIKAEFYEEVNDVIQSHL